MNRQMRNRVAAPSMLQPHITSILGIFAAIQLVLGAVYLVITITFLERIELFAFLPLVAAIALLAFVMARGLQARLGAYHMRLTILFSSADVLLVTHFFWEWSGMHWIQLAAGGSPVIQWLGSMVFTADSMLPPLSPLFVTLGLFLLVIVVSWQYELRYAIGYILVTTLVDSMIAFIVPGDTTQIIINIAVISGRVVAFLVMSAVITHLVSIQNKQHDSLLTANAKLTRHVAMVEELTISHERNRLARELHDTLAHTLSAASVQLEAAHSLWNIDSEKAHNSLAKALNITRDGLSETRRALKALRASPLDDLGLALALKELGELTEQRSGAKVLIALPQNMEPVPLEIEQALYRTTQEAFENIVHHAKASQVDLLLTQQHGSVTMTIKDDGIGFDVASAQSKPEHFGLRGMAERIESLGGHITIASQHESGACISMEMSLYDDSRNAV